MSKRHGHGLAQEMGYIYPLEEIKRMPDSFWSRMPKWNDLDPVRLFGFSEEKGASRKVEKWCQKFDIDEETLLALKDLLAKIDPTVLDLKHKNVAPYAPDSKRKYRADKSYTYIVYRVKGMDYMPFKEAASKCTERINLATRQNNGSYDWQIVGSFYFGSPVAEYLKVVGDQWNKSRRAALKRLGLWQNQKSEKQKEQKNEQVKLRVDVAAKISKLEDELEAYKEDLANETYTSEQISRIYYEMQELSTLNRKLRNTQKKL